MQTLNRRVFSSDQAHGQSCFGVRRDVQNGVDDGGALADQINVAMQTESHNRVGFQCLRPGRLRFQLRHIETCEEFQNRLNADIIAGALRQGSNAGDKFRVLLHDSLWFTFGVHAEYVSERVPE